MKDRLSTIRGASRTNEATSITGTWTAKSTMMESAGTATEIDQAALCKPPAARGGERLRRRQATQASATEGGRRKAEGTRPDLVAASQAPRSRNVTDGRASSLWVRRPSSSRIFIFSQSLNFCSEDLK
ncbi:hypothetical protein ANO11243_089200 [Dothideomycetidae sp. 11243]|nr:hypothetical protein ANO11243_089200 [fungal sp. No.11243]